MRPLVQLLRPLNSLMGAVAVFAGALVAVGSQLASSPHLYDTCLAAVVAFFFTGAGNALNDYYDRFTDRVNHPDRPLPRRKLRAEAARKFSILLFACGLGLALFIGWPAINYTCLAIALVNSLLLAGYEMSLKSRGFIGNLTVSYLTASLFLFGGASAHPALSPTVFPLPVLVLALLAFLASVGREIIKGIEDVRGDRDRTTLPRLLGTRTAGMLSGLWLGMAVLLSPFPAYPLRLFPPESYLPLVAAADAMFIYSVLVVFRNPALSTRLTKLAMVLALAGFLAGALAVT